MFVDNRDCLTAGQAVENVRGVLSHAGCEGPGARVRLHEAMQRHAHGKHRHAFANPKNRQEGMNVDNSALQEMVPFLAA